MMVILAYVAIGLVIGSLSGIMGIGGGVLLVPALIWLCGFDPKRAAGTSLAILIPPIGLPAALEAYRKSDVDLSTSLWIAGAFMVGAYVSRTLVEYVPADWFRLAFGTLMIFVAVRFMLDSDSEATNAAAGLATALLAWLGYLGLKFVGRRHLPPPTFGAHVQAKHEEGWADRDYQI
jgi:uncharacterized membrane protein YfcA